MLIVVAILLKSLLFTGLLSLVLMLIMNGIYSMFLLMSLSVYCVIGRWVMSGVVMVKSLVKDSIFMVIVLMFFNKIVFIAIISFHFMTIINQSTFW